MNVCRLRLTFTESVIILNNLQKVLRVLFKSFCLIDRNLFLVVTLRTVSVEVVSRKDQMTMITDEQRGNKTTSTVLMGKQQEHVNLTGTVHF